MKRQFNVYNYIVLILIILTSITATAQNILTNGDFELGGSGVGFKVDNPPSYTLATIPGTSVQGNYSFVTNPRDMNSSFISGVDHTTGTGKMMVVDGSTFGINYHFWNTGNTGGAIGGFVIGKSYVFSYWIKSVSNDVTNVATRANINLYTVDASSISPSITSSLAPLPANGWQQVSYTFVANKTNVLIQLYNTNTGALGNDFAIDDVSITCASPPNLIITNPATVCVPTTVNLTLPAVTATSDPGTLTYYTDATATPISQLSTPSAIATSGTYYIKNTASVGCETIRLVAVSIAPPVASPFVTTPINLCISAPTALLATPLLGNTLKWYGTAPIGGTASSIATIPSATGTYFVSQTNGVCESGRVAIQANLVADNGTTILNFRCDSSQIPGISSNYTPPATVNNTVLFDWSVNSNIPNSYNYSYRIQGGAPVTGNTVPTNLVVTGLVSGQSVEMTLTSALRPCVPAQTITCTVPCGTITTPNFPLITQIYCVGNTMPTLLNTSPNNISGTWLPAVISNAASGSYVFTPNPILFPCALTQTLNVTVNPIATPTFLTLPVSVCQNSTGQVLPTSSTNTIPITGFWGPFTSINTTILGTTTYTFIPDSGQCVSAIPTSVSIIVNSNATPTFNPITPLCAGTMPIPALPTPTNISPISGVWNPATIDNTATRDYEFVPDIGLHPCAPKIMLTVTVTPNVTPTFAVSDTQCEGTGIVTLPNTSTNTPTISGTWTDSTGTIISTINTSIVVVNPLFFTPNLGSCVISPTTPKTITVYTNAAPTFNPILDFCAGTPIPLLPPTSIEGIPGTWNPSAISGSVGTKIYQFTPNISCSPTPPPLAVTVLDSPTPTFLPIVPTDVCEGSIFALPDFSNDKPPITGSWETPSGPVTSIDTSIAGTDIYTFILDAGQCATAPDPIQITVNPSNTLTSVDPPTVTNAFEDNQIITVVATAPGNYLYQLDSGPLQTSPIFENVSAGTHTITVSDANGCSTAITKSDILVIKHPKYFTPNGDGFNDTWKISGLTNILITNIYIFDRYGKLLKEIAASGTGWDGTYLGVPMPADDYWFTVDYVEDFSPKEFKAHFSLKR